MPLENEQQSISEENEVLSLSIISSIGDREEQQDSYGYMLKAREGLIVICDGMGGHRGGKIASKCAVEKFLTNYDVGKDKEYLIECAKASDLDISEIADDNGEILKAGSTLVSVIIRENKLIWCSVGDSRAYLIRNGELVQLTQDHNYHTVLVEKRNAGIITEEEFFSEDKKGEALISYLGMGKLELIDYSETSFELIKDDRIILMSDGLYKLVSDEEIERLLNNFGNVVDAMWALEQKARKNAKNYGVSRDNMTIALIKIKQ